MTARPGPRTPSSAAARRASGPPFRFDEVTLRGGLNFTLTTDDGDIGLMGEVAGVSDYAAALAASEQVDSTGRPSTCSRSTR